MYKKHVSQYTKICLYCKKTFEKPYSCSLKTWNEKSKYCSRICRDKGKDCGWLKKYSFTGKEEYSKIGRFKKGLIPWNKNKKPDFSKSSYSTIHKWLQYHWKKSGKCSKCGIIPIPKGRLHVGTQWANISHKYLEDENDWIELCVRCHRRYDKGLIKL